MILYANGFPADSFFSVLQLVDLPDDIVAEQALFKTMQQHVQFLGSEYDTKRAEAEKASKEADELREGMESFRESVLVRCARAVGPFLS